MTIQLNGRTICIGGASGAWGDSPRAIGQLLEAGVDYLMMDYLAEVTMSLLARAQQRDPSAGFPPDALSYLVPHLGTLATTRTKVASNGGGMNPEALKQKLDEEISTQGLSLSVGIVTGDDVRQYLEVAEDESPYLTANAYLGALPIKAAFDTGADIVLTGRCADSALALGILMHEFDWTPEDFDLLASGSLVGHLLECGPQSTGGNFTDWDEVPDWHNIGYPIAVCDGTGEFLITKPEDTGGLIDTRCIAEQLFYEIGDPSSYILPDVIADFTGVHLEQINDQYVHVNGVKGRGPTSQYKVSCTRKTGYRSVVSVVLAGPNSVAKAEKTASELLLRAGSICEKMGEVQLTDHHVEVLGAESVYGVPKKARKNREVFLRVVMTHPDRAVLNQIAKEAGSIGLSFAPGVMGIYGGRPKSSPQIVLETRFIDKTAVPAPLVQVGADQPMALAIPAGDANALVQRPNMAPETKPPIQAEASDEGYSVPLGAIAHARSGDKGDSSNIAIIARHPAFYPALEEKVTEQLVRDHFTPTELGGIEKFPVPGLIAINFLIQDALGGGGIASLRIDPQGKAYGQRLLEARVEISADLHSLLDKESIDHYSQSSDLYAPVFP